MTQGVHDSRRDAARGRAEVERDIGEALDYLATLADSADFMRART